MESLLNMVKAGDTCERTIILTSCIRVVNDWRILLEDVAVPVRKTADFGGDEFTL